jgi:hypothetical protein
VIDLTIKLNKDGTEGGKAKAAKPARTSGIKRLPSKRRRISDKGWRFYDPFYYRPTLDAPFDYPPGFYKVSQFVAGDTPCDGSFEFPGDYADYLAYLNNFVRQFTRSNANHWYEITPNSSPVYQMKAYLMGGVFVDLTDVAEYSPAHGWIFDPAYADSIQYLEFSILLSEGSYGTVGYYNIGEAGTVIGGGWDSVTDEWIYIDWRQGGLALLRPYTNGLVGTSLEILEPGTERLRIYSPVYPCFPRRALLDPSSPQYGMTLKQVLDTMPGATLYEIVRSYNPFTCLSGGLVNLSDVEYRIIEEPSIFVNVLGIIIQGNKRLFSHHI